MVLVSFILVPVDIHVSVFYNELKRQFSSSSLCKRQKLWVYGCIFTV